MHDGPGAKQAERMAGRDDEALECDTATALCRQDQCRLARAPGRQVGRDVARFLPGEADLEGGSGDVRRMLEQHAKPDIAAHESGYRLEQAQLHPGQRAVRVMHGHEAETHQQKREAESQVVVVVHAAEQHRAEHRAVRDAKPGGQDVDPLAPQFDKNLTPEALTTEMVRGSFFTARDIDGNEVDLLQRGRERLQQNLERSGWCLYVGAVFLILLSKRPRDRALPLWMFAPALLLTAGELWQHGRPLIRGRETPHALDTPVHEFLRAQRVATERTGGFMVARANPLSEGGDPMHLVPGTLAKDRIRDLHFYTYVDRYSSEPIRALYGDAFMLRDYLPQALPDDARLQLPWWDALGVRYLFSTQPMQHAGTRVGPEWKGPGGEFFVYERATALPRAWVVSDLRAVGNDAAVVAAAIRSDFAPREFALVTDDDARTLPPLPSVPLAKERAVTFLLEDHKRLTIDVSDGPLGYLVLADTYLPGWTVECDGEELPLARGNVCMRVVPLPAKACRLEFRYRTPGLVPGLGLAAVAAVIALLLVLRARFTRSAPPPEHPPA